jgi:hypothetical protein
MPEGGWQSGRIGISCDGVCVDERVLKAQIRHEMEHAAASRMGGNEGRARVCARRAAGWAVNHLRQSNNDAAKPGNAYEALRWLQDQTMIEESVRRAAQRLTTRLTPEHKMPYSEDPLQDAEWVIKHIFNEDWRMFPLD